MGAGALIVRDGLALEPLIHGGGQELRRRAGTENLVGARRLRRGGAGKDADVKALRDRLEAALDGAVIFGADAERLPNTTCFAMPGMNAETLLMAFDLEGIAVSSGSACSSGKVAKSHVLAAMGVAPEISRAAIRVSLGWNTTDEHIDHFIAAWRKIVCPPQGQGCCLRKSMADIETIELVKDIDVDKYKYGFTTDIESDYAPKGLNEDIVRFISDKKNEPALDAGGAPRGLSPLAADGRADLGQGALSEDRLPGPLLLRRAQEHGRRRRAWTRSIPSCSKPMPSSAFR